MFTFVKSVSHRYPSEAIFAQLSRMETNNKGLRATFIGMVVSAVLAVIKGVGGIVGNSYALVADAIESTTDIVTSAMLWMGLRWAGKPADHDHPYGHGKGEALIAVGIGLALIAASIVIAVKSIQNIVTPHKTPEAFTLIILVAVIVTKEILYRFVLKTGDETGSSAVKADAFHHRSDAITSAAAFIGISIGLIGGPGYEIADDYAALFASAVILYNAYRIIRPAIGELLDEELDPELNTEVKKISAWAAILFAPTLVGTIYGMNFDHMPELHWAFGYPFALGLMGLVCFVLYRVFKKRHWL